MKRRSLAIVAGAVVFAAVMVLVSAFREQPLSTLELALWQIISLVLGLFGSYLFGRSSAASDARDLIGPQARYALRSVLVLYRGILRLSDAVERLKPPGEHDTRFELLQMLIRNQADEARSAIANWRDVIPDDYADVAATLDLADSIDDNQEA